MDLKMADDKTQIKSRLVLEIASAIKRLGLSQQAAGKQMGISQAKVSGLLRGDFSQLSEKKLMECLTKLGYDIEIQVRPSTAAMGKMMLMVA